MEKYINKELLWKRISAYCEKHAEYSQELFSLIEHLPTYECKRNEVKKIPHCSTSLKKSELSSPNKPYVIKVEWEKTFRGYNAWVCRYGNIVTQSEISAQNCIEKHLKKLQDIGIDTSNFIIGG